MLQFFILEILSKVAALHSIEHFVIGISLSRGGGNVKSVSFAYLWYIHRHVSHCSGNFWSLLFHLQYSSSSQCPRRRHFSLSTQNDILHYLLCCWKMWLVRMMRS